MSEHDSKKSLVTGITGQDGAYLTKLLLERGQEVVGTFRRTSSVNFWRLKELGVLGHPRLKLVDVDLIDPASLYSLLERQRPDWVFNLAAQSFVAVSFEQPLATAQYTGIGALNLLEAIRFVNPKIRFYQASSSEMYGKVQAVPQNEDTPFYPRSPYAVAKLYAHWITVNYRESYDIFATSGILFNHESPLRGQEFVTRKITNSVARIELGQQEVLELGNLGAERDWGHAADYVDGMCRMLEHDTPESFVLSTGRMSTVRRFVELAFEAVGTQIAWTGEGVDEIGRCTSTGRVLVRVNPAFFRPAEVEQLLGDASKAKQLLGWEARIELEEMCREMVTSDLERNRRGFSF